MRKFVALAAIAVAMLFVTVNPAHAGAGGPSSNPPLPGTSQGPCPGTDDPTAVEHLVYNNEGACKNYHAGDNIGGPCPGSTEFSPGGHVWNTDGTCHNVPIAEITLQPGHCGDDEANPTPGFEHSVDATGRCSEVASATPETPIAQPVVAEAVGLTG